MNTPTVLDDCLHLLLHLTHYSILVQMFFMHIDLNTAFYFLWQHDRVVACMLRLLHSEVRDSR